MKTDTTVRELEALLPEALLADAAWARHVLGGIRKRLARDKPVDDLMNSVSERLRTSLELAGARRKRSPKTTYDESLPITAHREAIISALGQHPITIVAGETGSGKTTQLPKFCLEAGRGVRGYIGCTQPRRIAARAMAERVAEELGSCLGDLVGYQVRFREALRSDSLVKFMTDGILLSETRHDPQLLAYDTLIVDEAHERSLNIDFLLGYLKRLSCRRPDLRIVITSATIDTGRFSAHFNDAPVIEVSGRGYPVEIRYQPLIGNTDNQRQDRNLYRGIAEAIAQVGRIDPRGDILVFLSGEREIHEARDYLSRAGLRNTEVLPLYARLSAAAQHRVFHPGTARRVILSTNIAETSLTVPGIRFVIDSGLARISRYAHRSRIQRLPIEPISQASANQRAGRCGRLGPGVCIRLYEEQDFEQRPAFTEPEIQRTALDSVVLRMLTMGLGEVDDFPFLDPPPPRMVSDAYQLLFELGAIDEDRAPTDLGYRLSRWPLDVRMARMVLEGAELRCAGDLIVLAAGLSIQDPRERPPETRQQADEAHDAWADERSDFRAMLKLWAELKRQRRERSGNRFRRWCRDHYLHHQRVLEWFDLVQQLRDQAREEGLALEAQHAESEALHQALLSGLLSQVGQKHPEEPVYVGVRNRRFSIFPGSGLHGRSPRWLMAAEVVETSRPYARTCAEIRPEWIERQGRHLLKAHHFDPHWSPRRGQVMAWQQLSLYGLVIVERRAVAFGPVDPVAAREVFITQALVPGRLTTSSGFVNHNRAAREEVLSLERRRRRHDLMLDERRQAEWFDQRLGEGISSVKGLEAWLSDIGDAEGQCLRLQRGDLLIEEPAPEFERQYPTTMELGGHVLDIAYRFDPGADDDGMTLAVPLQWLNTLDAGALEWLVPGYRWEKADAHIRSLPKPQRRALTPVSEYAERALEMMDMTTGQSFRSALAQALNHISGLELGAADFDESALPGWLRFRIRVTDEDGSVLAVSRDLEALQRRFGDRARRQFMDRQGEEWNQDGLVSWSFGDLPRQCTLSTGVTAWPALVDQRDAVGIRLFDTPEDAAWSQTEGVRRLVGLVLAEKLAWHRKNHGMSQSGLAAWTPRGGVESLVRDLAWSTLGALSDPVAHRVRSQQAFDESVDQVRRSFGPEFRRRAKLMEETLTELQLLQAEQGALDRRAPDAGADVAAVLDDLLYEGFLLETGPDQFKHYPRYLKAVRVRVSRALENPARDAELCARVEGHWYRYQQCLADGREYDEALDRFRWLCHEYRVSVFAQTLGTACKVSPKRLDAAWSEVLAAS